MALAHSLFAWSSPVAWDDTLHPQLFGCEDDVLLGVDEVPNYGADEDIHTVEERLQLVHAVGNITSTYLHAGGAYLLCGRL